MHHGAETLDHHQVAASRPASVPRDGPTSTNETSSAAIAQSFQPTEISQSQETAYATTSSQQETSTLEEGGKELEEITSELQTYQPQRQSYSSQQNGSSQQEPVQHPQYAGPVPDDASSDEADSAVGSNGSTHSTSLKEQAFRFRHFNGRRYHAEQGNGTEYYLPNDELELDRLDLQHHLFLLTLKGSLHCAPLPQDIESVLDIGTGTGIWAIDFADMHPSCVVVGTDLSPIQPPYIPPNCRFYVEDAEKPWAFDRAFDYIHGRMLVPGIKNWPEFFHQAYSNLKPGGYIELQDLNFPLRCDDDTAPPDSPMMRWSSYMMEAAHNLDIELDASKSFPTLLAVAGFRDIRSETHAWPANRWPREQGMKERGMWVMQDFLQGLQGFSMAYFTRGLGWKAAEVEVLLSGVRTQARDRRSHVYMPVSFFWARKPE